MSEKTKKQNRGTKFAWFACLAFTLGFGFGFWSLTLIMPFDNSETLYATNAARLPAPMFLGFGASVGLFLLFRLCTCGFKKASRVYRINIISMLLLLAVFLGICGFCIPSFLPMMLTTERELLDGTAPASYRGHGFLALFSGYNDWLIWTILFSPVFFLLIYVLMYVLMVKSAKEVRADIKVIKTAKRNERNAKIKAEKEKTETQRAALQAKKEEERRIAQKKKEAESRAFEMKREEERKRLEEEHIKKDEERKALAKKKEEERLAFQEQKRAEKEEKAKEAANEKAMAMLSKAEAVAVKDPETASQADDIAGEIMEYQKRKNALKPAYLAFLLVSLPILILQTLCVPAIVEIRSQYSGIPFLDAESYGTFYCVVVGDVGVLPLFIAFLYFILNLVFLLLGLFNTKKMTLALRVLTFSSLGCQLLGGILNFIPWGSTKEGFASCLTPLIFTVLLLALLIATIVLLTLPKYKGNEKIKNYVCFGALGLLIVFEAIFDTFPAHAFLAFHPGYGDPGNPTPYNYVPGFIIAVIFFGLAFFLVFFSKRLAEGYVLSKTLPALGKKPHAMTDEEKLEALQKDCKIAMKKGDTSKVTALSAEIVELTEKIKNNPRGISTFDGRLIQLIGYRLLGALITGITFGIGYPWAKCFVERWSVKHLVIDGKRLSFDGKGVQLLGKFILWVFLSIITFGIFSFWFAIKMKKWTASHSHIEGSENPVESKSTFDGRLIQLIGYNLLSLLMTVFTLGIAYPWAKCLKENWGVKHTIIDGRRLEFDGTGIQLFGKYIVWLILTFITFGIYGFWLNIKMKKWVASHTHFETMTIGEASKTAQEEEIKQIPEQDLTKESESWICPNCKTQCTGKFCSNCGNGRPNDQ